MAKRSLVDSTSVRRHHNVILYTRRCASKAVGYRSITARTTTEDMGSMKVTISINEPPLLSYFDVSCPELKDDYFTESPEILWSSEYCILFRMFLRYGPPPYFIYRAEQPGCKQSLDPLPEVGSYFASESLNPYLVGVVPDVDSRHCVLVAFKRDWVSRKYELHVFRSKGLVWSKHLLGPDFPSWINKIRPGLFPDKVVVLGEEVGYVDLWKGILFCKVLEEQVTTRFIPLPNLLPNNREYYDQFSASEIRDVTCTETPDGLIIKCVEMEDLFSSIAAIPDANELFDSDVDPTKHLEEPICDAWRVVTWYRETSWNHWCKEHIVNADDVEIESYIGSDLQPSCPILCGDDRVGLLYKSEDDDDGCILIIDLERKTASGLSNIYCERSMLFSSAIACAPKKCSKSESDGGHHLSEADGTKRMKWLIHLPQEGHQSTPFNPHQAISNIH